MIEMIDDLVASGSGPWLVAAFAVAMLLVFSATVWSSLARLPDARRYAPAAAGGALRSKSAGDGDGLDRFLLPQAKDERWQVQRLLHRAGYRGPRALRQFYVIRLGLAGAGIAVTFVALPFVRSSEALQGGALDPTSLVLVMLAVAVIAGFYGPLLWVRQRAGRRQTQIRRAFPEALDLLHVMVQAGLGLDAALQRVSEDIGRSCSALAEELHLVVLELRAGKSREQALDAFAQRVDLDQVRAFTTVLEQSMRYGTSVSDALEVFSADMRNERMMLAEEKANQLPVKMSVILVMFMLPAVIAVAMGPVVIRAIRVIAPNLGG